MERLESKDYNEAKGCLLRYNYNCLNIKNKQTDILGLSVSNMDGLPKAPYFVGDPTFKKLIKLNSDESLQKSIREYKAVTQALELVSADAKIVFMEEFINKKSRYDVIDVLCRSEETYKRRRRELIYSVSDQLKNFK